jgi:hypothetical protein
MTRKLSKKWLDTCITSHASCKTTIRGAEDPLSEKCVPLPKRLINVSPQDGSQEPLLLEAHGLRGVYVTLSHCWGDGSVTRTAISTLEQHKLSVPLAAPCSNFRDAILTTRRLGF